MITGITLKKKKYRREKGRERIKGNNKDPPLPFLNKDNEKFNFNIKKKYENEISKPSVVVKRYNEIIKWFGPSLAHTCPASPRCFSLLSLPATSSLPNSPPPPFRPLSMRITPTQKTDLFPFITITLSGGSSLCEPLFWDKNPFIFNRY